MALDGIVAALLALAAVHGGAVAPWAVPSATTLVAVTVWGALAGTTFWIVVYASSVRRGVRTALR